MIATFSSFSYVPRYIGNLEYSLHSLLPRTTSGQELQHTGVCTLYPEELVCDSLHP